MSLMQLAQRAQRALEYRGTRLALALELVDASGSSRPGTAAKQKGEVQGQDQGQAGAAKQQRRQQLVAHFLEYEAVADALLRPKPRRYELALKGSHQLDHISKVVALRNQHMASPSTGEQGNIKHASDSGPGWTCTLRVGDAAADEHKVCRSRRTGTPGPQQIRTASFLVACSGVRAAASCDCPTDSCQILSD